MKRVLCVFMIVIVGFANGQSQEMAPGDSIPWEIRKQAFIYNTAMIFNDPVVARTALYSILATNPANVAIYDSLAILYFQANQTASAALAAQQALQIEPQDQFAMEIAAASLEKLGAKDKALDNYKIAFLQMEERRYAEADNTLDIIINDTQSESNLIGFPTADGNGQEVSLKAASMRVKAMILEDKGDTEGAKSKYLELLEMQPGFQVVQQQLRELTKTGGQ